MGSDYLRRLDLFLSKARSWAELLELIVNSPFHNRIQTTRMDLGIVVLLLVNKKEGTIDRIALSDTELAAGAVRMSEKPFREIKIPIDYPGNAVARAINTGEPQFVTDWTYIFVPALDSRASRFNQAGAGIEFSCVYPLKACDGGALIFSYYQESKNIKNGHFEFMENYTKLADKHLGKASKSDCSLALHIRRPEPKGQDPEVPARQ